MEEKISGSCVLLVGVVDDVEDNGECGSRLLSGVSITLLALGCCTFNHSSILVYVYDE